MCYRNLQNAVEESNIINVLDDGFVKFIDCMGDDIAVVQAARISYGSGSKGTTSDRQLIRYLMRNGHMSPFEMVELKFHIRLPIDVMRQLVRHRTASINEYSTRYTKAIDSVHKIGINEWRKQSNKNKQGSSDEFIDAELGSILSQDCDSFSTAVYNKYNELLENGVSREQARQILPLSTYTEIYWKMNLRNLFHFLSLRLDGHAQKEIREYAKAIYYFAHKFFPMSTDAFSEFVLSSVTFSQTEIKILVDMCKKGWVDSESLSLIDYLQKIVSESSMSDTERVEFLNKLGIVTYG